jgi:hypothetical protein
MDDVIFEELRKTSAKVQWCLEKARRHGCSFYWLVIPLPPIEVHQATSSSADGFRDARSSAVSLSEKLRRLSSVNQAAFPMTASYSKQARLEYLGVPNHANLL